MDVAPSVSEDSQNGRTEESEVKKPSDVEAVPRLDIKTPICWMDGAAYSINLSSGTGTMASSHEIGPYDDLVPSQVSLKERVKDGCRSCFSLDTLKKLFPIFVWLPDYNFLKLAFDLVAGITVGVTIIPQALAFAGIAGLAPQYGLYSGIICCFVYVLMGSAKDITLGPSAITSLLTAAFATSLSPKLPNGDTDPTMAIMLTLTTGLILIFMGVCQLGIMVSFISFPVINAFSSAAAVTIAVSQLGTLLGLAGVPNEFIASLDNIRKRIPDINVWDMVMGLACIVAVFTIKGLRCIKFKDNINKTTPKCILLVRQTLHICASASTAIVVILASITLYILELNDIKALTPTGYIKPGLPEFLPPSFSIHNGNYTMSTSEMFANLASGIIVTPFIAFIEAMAIGKYFARVNRYKLDPSQELLSYGVANVLTSFFQGYPITGTFARTAINSQCGVKTTLGCTFTGVIVIIGLAFMTPIFYYIPKCALAGVIVAAVLTMVDIRTFVALYKANKIDVFPYLVTFVSTLLIGVQWGIFVGVGVSLLILLYPIARPKLLFSSVQGFMVVTPMSGLTFPSAEYLEIKALDKALDVDKPSHVILNMEHLSFMDFSGIQAIKSLLAECEVNEIKLILAQGQKRVRRQLQLAQITNLIIVQTVQEAIHKFTMEMTLDESGDCGDHYVVRSCMTRL